MRELPQKNIQKNENRKGRGHRTAEPTAVPADGAFTTNINMTFDEVTLNKFAADQKNQTMAMMPDIFGSVVDAARDLEVKMMQSKMGDRIFADRTFRGPIRTRGSLGEINGVAALLFGESQMLMIQFDVPMEGAVVQFDKAAGTDVRFALHATPAERVETMRRKLDIWSRRRALDPLKCTCGPTDVENVYAVTAAFSDGSDPVTLTFPFGEKHVHETRDDAAKSAFAHWEQIRKWKADADTEPADLNVEFAVFRKLRSVTIATCNTKCAFVGAYYGVDVEAPTEKTA